MLSRDALRSQAQARQAVAARHPREEGETRGEMGEALDVANPTLGSSSAPMGASTAHEHNRYSSSTSIWWL